MIAATIEMDGDDGIVHIPPNVMEGAGFDVGTPIAITTTEDGCLIIQRISSEDAAITTT